MNLKNLRRLVLETVQEERTKKRLAKTIRKARLVLEGEEEKAEAPAGDTDVVDINAGPEEILIAAKKMADPKSNFNNEKSDPNEKIELKSVGPLKPSEMFPTQAEIGSGKSLNDQCTNQFGALDKVLKGGLLGMAPGTPILVFQGGGKTWVLDGHHRWSQFLATRPTDDCVQAIAISAPNVDNEAAALALCHAVQFGLHGQSITKDWSGENLLKMDEKAIKALALKLIDGGDGAGENGDIVQKLVDAGKLEAGASKDDAAGYFAGNLAKLAKMQGPFTRKVMPQMAEKGQTTDITSPPAELAGGNINYTSVKKESVGRWQTLAGILKD
jgi:hypothetical protein